MRSPNEPGFPAKPEPPPLPLTWPAALFGLLFGVAMTYAPYEFRTEPFRPLHPYVRAMGVAYLVSSITLLATMLYPNAPRWLDVLGRVLYAAVTGLYWWVVNVRTGGLTGALLYPLMLCGLALETWPAFRRRELFRGFVSLIAVAFGLAMLAAPERFTAAFYVHLMPLLMPLGLLLLAGGLGLLAPLGTRWPRLPRLCYAPLGVAFALLAWALGRGGSWPGASIYVTLALSCAASALSLRPRTPRTVGWKLLRGLAFAGLVPLLALGGLAAYLAQHAIERQVREDTERLAAGEADSLGRSLDDARKSLQFLLESPGFRSAFASKDRGLLESFLRTLPAQAPAFDAALVVDHEGQVLASSDKGPGALAGLRGQDVHQGESRSHTLHVSRPFTGPLGPRVALALPLQHEGPLEGALVGVLSLRHLSAAVTSAAQRFRVQVLDRRGSLLLHDTWPGAALLSEVQLPSAPPPTAEGSLMKLLGLEESPPFSAAPVPGTLWSVIVTQDLGVAHRAITRMSIAVILMLVAGVVLTLALSQVVARDVIRRLGALREATAALAKGDLSRRVDVEHNEEDELGELSRSFNEMAARTEAAQAELREAVRAREEFLSVASHELRTPLTPLKGFAALTLQRVERGADFPERERLLKALRSMARQTDRLTRLVDDLLDTSRIQAGRFELERQQVDLVPLVREVLERFELRGADGLRFELEAPDSPAEGWWDGPRLEQVVTNLLSNAVRYSPQGGTVRVSFHLSSEHVELRVCDQGIGIPPESLAALFQPFSRAPNATSRHFGGLGLGLYICREIVQRHGGSIWAESPGPQRGSCFHVRLPRQLPTLLAGTG